MHKLIFINDQYFADLLKFALLITDDVTEEAEISGY